MLRDSGPSATPPHTLLAVRRSVLKDSPALRDLPSYGIDRCAGNMRPSAQNLYPHGTTRKGANLAGVETGDLGAGSTGVATAVAGTVVG